MREINAEEFQDAVEELAKEDGITRVMAIPGVMDVLLEYYNNAALDRLCWDDDEDHARKDVDGLA